MPEEIQKSTSIILPQDMIDILDKMAKSLYTDRSSIIRQMISYSLKHHPYFNNIAKEIKVNVLQ